jgi:hypothetical protein
LSGFAATQQRVGYHLSHSIRLKEVPMPDIEALIRERAYLIWEKSGKPLGRETDHWFQAAREIAEAQAKKPRTVTAVETMPPPTTGEAGPAPKRGGKPAPAKRTLFKKK